MERINMFANPIIKQSVRCLKSLMLLITFGLVLIGLLGCSGGDDGGGGGGEADIDVSEIQLLFGGVALNHFSEREISIQNKGSSNLDIGQVAQTNPLSAPFSIVNDQCSGQTVAAWQTCTFRVRFLPTSQDSFDDDFDIPSNDPDEDALIVAVQGEGRALNVSINHILNENCPDITLYVSVVDENDDPQTGLTMNDFDLYEDNVLQTITNFLDTVTSPLSVVLLLDYSPSMETAEEDIEEGAKSFIDVLDTANNDEAAIFKFDEDPYVVMGFSTNKDDLKAAIDDDFPGGERVGTSLYEVIWLSVQKIVDDANALHDRRAVVVIGDGSDTSSNETLNEVIDHAVENGVHVFTIGLGDVNFEVMERLADETGGQFFLATDSNDLQDIYLQISEILSNQYVIEYNSSSIGGSEIVLDVEVDFNSLEGEDTKEVQGCP